MSCGCVEGEGVPLWTTRRPPSTNHQALPTTQRCGMTSKASTQNTKPRHSSALCSHFILALTITAVILLALAPSCQAASSEFEEQRSLSSFSPSALKKRLGTSLRPSGRSYFDAEDILLFMLGLGLASMLGLATFMAPFTSILATGLTPVAVQGNVPAAAATVTQGRRRRRSASWAEGSIAARLLNAIDEAHGRYKDQP
ncbi:uncharacterized protein LOC144169143 [Haemaphysalis longicornis]